MSAILPHNPFICQVRAWSTRGSHQAPTDSFRTSTASITRKECPGCLTARRHASRTADLRDRWTTLGSPAARDHTIQHFLSRGRIGFVGGPINKEGPTGAACSPAKGMNAVLLEPVDLDLVGWRRAMGRLYRTPVFLSSLIFTKLYRRISRGSTRIRISLLSFVLLYFRSSCIAP